MKDETKSAMFMIRMKPSVKTAAEKAAADANRSLSSFIETLLVDRLRAGDISAKDGGADDTKEIEEAHYRAICRVVSDVVTGVVVSHFYRDCYCCISVPDTWSAHLDRLGMQCWHPPRASGAPH